MATGRHVFISYSPEDRPFVDRLSADLRKAGFKTWVDLEQIAGGDSWKQKIADAIGDAQAYIFVSSSSSVARSESIMYLELRLAMDRGLRLNSNVPFIFPLVLDADGADHLLEDLQKFHWVDFRAGYREGLDQLIRRLPPEIRQKDPLSPEQHKSKGYVFISYANDDADFVERLKRFLGEKSYAYWDYAESDRDYHTQLSTELEEAISNAVATLSVLSPSWKKSKWTLKEYFFAEEIGIPVFLLKAKKMGPALATAGIPFIDFVDDEHKGFQRLHKELTRKGL